MGRKCSQDGDNDPDSDFDLDSSQWQGEEVFFEQAPTPLCQGSLLLPGVETNLGLTYRLALS